MKKIMLLLMVAIVSMAVSAQQMTALSHNLLHKSINKEMLGHKRHAIDASHIDAKAQAPAKAPQLANAEVVTPPQDLETENYRLNGYLFDGSSWEQVSTPVKVGIDGDNVYIQGVSVLLPEAWIKGTLNSEDMTVSFPMQYYGKFNNYDDYFFPVTPVDGGYAPIDAVFNYNAELGTFILSQDVVCYIVENSSDIELSWFYQFDSQMTIVPEGDVVEVPEGLETQDYALTGTYMGYEDNWFEGDPLASNAKVGFDGDDIYVQGLCVYLPQAWVKGHREGDTYVFDNGQYFGTFIYQGDAYQFYFMGATPYSNDPAPMVMTLDEATGTLTAQQWYAISASDEEVRWYDIHGNVKLTPIQDVAATPAKPTFGYYEYYADDDFGFVVLNIPTLDVDGNPLLTGKLGYQLFVDRGNGPEQYIFAADLYGFDEDMTTIPYNFGDDINFMAHGELAVVYGLGEGVQQMGVRSVYTGGGETHYSDIDWYNVYENEKVVITPPEGLEANTYTLTATDLQFGEEYPEEHKADVLVGFDGNDVYIQGLSKWITDAWVKGTMADDGTTVTFPKHFLGNFDAWGIDMEIVFNGATMAYDPETDTFTTAEGYTSTSTYQLEGETYDEPADVMTNVVITRAADVAAIPAAPEILNFALNEGYGYMLEMNIPLEDVDGNPIFASKLSYQLFSMQDGEESPITLEASRYEYATEDLTIIPYLYTDYWEVLQGGETVYVHADGIENWQAIGAKSIYTGGGETNESPITWFEINNSGITEVTAGQSQNMQLYDLLGRRVDQSKLRPGIYVRQDGRKVVIK